VGTDDQARFRALYRAHADPVLAFALRRVRQPEDAADVVAQTFTVAWRRVGELPPGDEARLWLYGVARNVLANVERGHRRRGRLGERLRHELSRSYSEPDPAVALAEAAAVSQALQALPAADREVLTLSAWEGLEPREIATVLGVEPTVARMRLSRARKRCRTELLAAGYGHTALGHGGDVMPVPAGEEEAR
jgi:RNA polymerase sigma-70 factor (ECF subfamily)